MSKNQKGLTLIEMLAAVIIFSIVIIAVTSIIVQAIENNKTIKKDIALRDEAELILAQAVRNIYTTRETEISKVEDNFIYIQIPKSELNVAANPDLYECDDTKCTVRTGFQKKTIGGKNETLFYVNSTIVTIGNSNVKIHPDTTIIRNENASTTGDSTTLIPTYKIKLGVYIIDEKNTSALYTQWFENEINSINNL